MFFKDFTIEKTQEVKVLYTVTEKEKDLSVMKVDLEFKDGENPEPLTLKWREIPDEYIGVWEPLGKFNKNFQPFWSKRTNLSKISCSEPVMCVYKENFTNGITVALSDCINSTVLKCGVDEYGGEVEFEVVLFSEKTCAIKNYSIEIYEDKRNIPINKAIKSANGIWIKDAYDVTPQAAYDPVYSTWYNFHRDVNAEELLKELPLAAESGLKTLIIDDGWQIDGDCDKLSYDRCGDWQISEKKFPDMKAFVDKAHELGIKVLLWYSVPFMGYESEHYGKFKGKYLYDIPSMKTCVLDTRYAEIRSFLVETYKNAMLKYGLDGFKLDFIDNFRLSDESPDYDPETMDCCTPEDGTRKLLSEISDALKSIKPDVLIEFRQGYVGTEVMKLGNMVRVADCVADRLSNLTGSVDLRLINVRGAVHSDMLVWHKNDGIGAVAGQLLATAFSVPQISVKLAELSQRHKNYLKNYLDFYGKHKNAMLKGEITVKGFDKNYTQVTSSYKNESVTVCYADGTIDLVGEKTQYVLNAMGDTTVLLKAKEKDKKFCVEIFNADFEKTEKTQTVHGMGVVEIPQYGYACIKEI